jgi:putative nucleotidyltransferase with HDIG domain
MSTLGQDTPQEVRNSGFAATLSIPVAAHGEEREPQSELERELLRRLKSGRAALPVLPQVAALALRLASDPDARLHQLAELVDTDPPIAARFLSVANSALYFRGSTTATTQAAIVRLGLASTRDLLFQVVYGASSNGLKRHQSAVQQSFQRSVRCAIAARLAAQELGQTSSYDYMLGLLHDIGEARVYRILADIAGPQPASEVQKLVHRYHSAAGAEVAMAWRLPTEIVDACAAHHDPAAATAPHVRLAMLSDALVDGLPSGDTTRLVVLELSPATAAVLLERLKRAAVQL